jgi:hypothetical protein
MTIDELEKRVAALEQEVSFLRKYLLPSRPGEESPAEAAWRRALAAALQAPAVAAAWTRFMEHMGIKGLQYMPPEKLREMIAAEGVKPEDNEFSRALIEMREE